MLCPSLLQNFQTMVIIIPYGLRYADCFCNVWGSAAIPQHSLAWMHLALPLGCSVRLRRHSGVNGQLIDHFKTIPNMIKFKRGLNRIQNQRSSFSSVSRAVPVLA